MSKSDLETGATVEVPHICLRDTVKIDRDPDSPYKLPSSPDDVKTSDVSNRATGVIEASEKPMTEIEAREGIISQLTKILNFLESVLSLYGKTFETLPEQISMFKKQIEPIIKLLGNRDIKIKNLMTKLEDSVFLLIGILQEDMGSLEGVALDFQKVRVEIRKYMAALGKLDQ